MSESKAKAQSEAWRLRAAIATIHDHLHHNRVDEAHEVCECAERGDDVAPANISLDEAARLMRFMGHFNTLCKQLGMRAAAFMVVPSKTQKGAVSIQIGGEVMACKMLEELMEKRSTYMGEHVDQQRVAAPATGLILPPGVAP